MPVRLLGRYIIAGAVGGVIQTAGLYLWISVLGLARDYLWGVVVAYLVALVVTFAMQKYWTFRDRVHTMIARQAVLYTATSLGNLGINLSVLYLGKLLLEAAGLDFFRGWYLFVQVLAVGSAAFAAFLMNYHVTFRLARLGADEAVE